MSDPLEEALVEGLRGMQCSERQLRAETGYSPSLACAREVSLQGAEKADLTDAIHARDTLRLCLFVPIVRCLER